MRLILILATTLALTACTPGGQSLWPSASVDAQQQAQGQATLQTGHRLMAAGEYQMAYDAYILAASRLGLTAELRNAIASASLRLGRLNEAEQQLRRVLELDDSSAEAWNNLGVVLMGKGEFAEARQVFRRAFVLSGGSNDLIRENLRLAIANMENPEYDDSQTSTYKLVWRGTGDVLITSEP